MRQNPSLAQRAQLLLAHSSLWRAGPTRAPMVFLLHGCGGRQPFLDLYAQAGMEAGVHTCVVDSFAPRGIGRRIALATVCTGLRLRGAQRAGDVYALLDWARGQDWIEADRIGLAGWSHGGWTIMDGLAAGRDRGRLAQLDGVPQEPMAGLAGIFLVYPYCGIGALSRQRGWSLVPPRVELVQAGKDSVALSADIQATFATLDLPADQFTHTFFPDATHAFDDQEARDIRFRFDPSLLAASLERFAAFCRALAQDPG